MTTLEEAIAHHRWAAGNCVGEVRDEHLRMVTWLEELVQLKAENAKLRELAKAAWGCVKRQVSCDDCRIVACGCTMATAMRELGIEVDG